MKKRGLTLIEILLALALLSGIVIASFSWTRIAGHAAVDVVEPIRQQAAAIAVLQLIHDDLMSGDFRKTDSPAQSEPARVSVVDNEPLIVTCAAHGWTSDASDGAPVGQVVRRYKFNSQTGMLELRTQNLPVSSPAIQGIRPLLGGITGWEVQLDSIARQLTVTIKLPSDSLSRSYRIP